MCLKAKDMLQTMISPIIPQEELLPLLPFYGGIIVNVEYMNEHTTAYERGIFERTLHQYIGCLWNELLRNGDVCAVIMGTGIVALGYDVEEKTYLNELPPYLKGVQGCADIEPPPFYDKLCLRDEIKEELKEYSVQVLRGLLKGC